MNVTTKVMVTQGPYLVILDGEPVGIYPTHAQANRARMRFKSSAWNKPPQVQHACSYRRKAAA